MTDAERTEWRKKANYWLGWRFSSVQQVLCAHELSEKVWRLYAPDGSIFASGANEEEVYNHAPNPFDSAEDCETLLVATLNKRASELPVWKGTGRGSDMGAWWFGIDGHQQGVYVRTQSHRGQIEIETWSDDSDRRAAYREAVVQACVKAFEAMEEAEIHPAKPLAEGNHTKRD